MKTPILYWQQTSLRFKLIVSVLIMTTPLIGMLIYNNYYAIHVVRGQVADSYKNTLKLYKNQIDSNLDDIDSYMSTVAGSGYDLLSLSQAATDGDYYSSKIYLFNKLSQEINLFDPIGSFFVYTKHRQDYLNVSKSDPYAIKEHDRIQEFIIDYIHESPFPQGGSSSKVWTSVRIDDDNYLIDIVHAGDAYLGAWIKTDEILTPLDSLQIGEGGEALLANMQNEPISNSILAGKYGIELKQDVSEYYISGTRKKFLVIGAPSNRGDFNTVALVPDEYILAKLPYLQYIIWFITLAAFLFVPIGLYSMRRSILLPLYRLLRTMKKVREGDWSSRVELSHTSGEFQIIGGAFNAMMSEVERLRVNVYEEQLNKQKEELQRLQLQVNPHFFLNTLNIIYNLAKVKNYDLILEMTMSLIEYFRYMFRSNTSFVPLRDELDHTRNYLKIQSLRFPEKLKWVIHSPEYLSDVPIPPLVIQSFVENAIKHAVTLDEPLSIVVNIEFLTEEQGSRMKISIRDSGQGFNRELLAELQAGRSVANELGEHTGIWNVERRIRLLYGETASIQYDNDKETGGARIEMIMPTNPGMEETR
ncbi:two-component system, sensor histidine kinase YesM [Paenibacillus catalpae]|uniref:Two-component system, sensor histidine kinase YesM n=1 Tax=Paenibacillus catalpae TaxID=1045775 RepID=A0A1I2BC01_9BACL|nr:histidine kinase [Paenibacillus catalpae]SFE53681.1 two-component system, sensor histidine kinase YesM [Paenibacillus catalpae]